MTNLRVTSIISDRQRERLDALVADGIFSAWRVETQCCRCTLWRPADGATLCPDCTSHLAECQPCADMFNRSKPEEATSS